MGKCIACDMRRIYKLFEEKERREREQKELGKPQMVSLQKEQQTPNAAPEIAKIEEPVVGAPAVIEVPEIYEEIHEEPANSVDIEEEISL